MSNQPENVKDLFWELSWVIAALGDVSWHDYAVTVSKAAKLLQQQSIRIDELEAGILSPPVSPAIAMPSRNLVDQVAARAGGDSRSAILEVANWLNAIGCTDSAKALRIEIEDA